jgi:uncharacterized protein (UPF0248 family)
MAAKVNDEHQRAAAIPDDYKNALEELIPGLKQYDRESMVIVCLHLVAECVAVHGVPLDEVETVLRAMVTDLYRRAPGKPTQH